MADTRTDPVQDTVRDLFMPDFLSKLDKLRTALYNNCIDPIE